MTDVKDNSLFVLFTRSLPLKVFKITLLFILVIICMHFGYTYYMKQLSQNEYAALQTVPQSSVQEVELYLSSLDLDLLKKNVITTTPDDTVNIMHLYIDLQYMNERVKLFAGGEQQYLPPLAQIRFNTHETIANFGKYYYIVNFLLVPIAFCIYLFVCSAFLSLLFLGVAKLPTTSEPEHQKICEIAKNPNHLLGVSVLILGLTFAVFI